MKTLCKKNIDLEKFFVEVCCEKNFQKSFLVVEQKNHEQKFC